MHDSGPVLVIGGTKGTGLLIVERLLQRSRPVRALARDPARAADRLGTGVAIVAGDVTKPETLPAAVDGAAHIIFTAGAPRGRPTGRARVKAIVYDGVLNTLAAARAAGFGGRFLYMTACGVTRRSLTSIFLNLVKGNTLVWRRQSERAIRASGFDYTIVRAAILRDRPGGHRAVRITQQPLALSPRYRIARADVADVFVAALDHARAARTTFDIAWDRGARREAHGALLDRLQRDAEAAS